LPPGVKSTDGPNGRFHHIPRIIEVLEQMAVHELSAPINALGRGELGIFRQVVFRAPSGLLLLGGVARIVVKAP
jgi:hypothetical protein